MTKLLQDINLGNNIRKIRKSRHMTQMDVCAKMDLIGRPMLQSTYAQIKTGKRNIFVSDLIALKIIFDVNFDDIFSGLIPMKKMVLRNRYLAFYESIREIIFSLYKFHPRHKPRRQPEDSSSGCRLV